MPTPVPLPSPTTFLGPAPAPTVIHVVTSGGGSDWWHTLFDGSIGGIVGGILGALGAFWSAYWVLKRERAHNLAMRKQDNRLAGISQTRTALQNMLADLRAISFTQDVMQIYRHLDRANQLMGVVSGNLVHTSAAFGEALEGLNKALDAAFALPVPASTDDFPNLVEDLRAAVRQVSRAVIDAQNELDVITTAIAMDVQVKEFSLSKHSPRPPAETVPGKVV